MRVLHFVALSMQSRVLQSFSLGSAAGLIVLWQLHAFVTLKLLRQQ
jgi:hypothetical protein